MFVMFVMNGSVGANSGRKKARGSCGSVPLFYPTGTKEVSRGAVKATLDAVKALYCRK
jgi:hypothetical protein